MKIQNLSWVLIPLVFMGCGNGENNVEVKNEKVALGKMLFNDKSLSKNRSMSCATCHDEAKGFVDGRTTNRVNHAAAHSADETKTADRNVPTASYAAFIPEFGTMKMELIHFLWEDSF